MKTIHSVTLTIIFTLLFTHSLIAQKKILIPYRYKNLWGYCDTTGKIVIQPKYDSVGLFNTSNYEGAPMAYVFLKKKMGVIKSNGQLLLLPKLDSVAFRYSSNWINAILIRNEGKFGLLDYNLQTIAPAVYDQLNIYNIYKSDGYWATYVGYKYLGRIKDQYYQIEPDGKRTTVSREFFQKNYTNEADQEWVEAPGYDKPYFNDKVIEFEKFRVDHKESIDSIATSQFQKKSGYYLLYKNNKVGFIAHRNLLNQTYNMVIPSFDEIVDAYYSYEEKLECFLVKNDGYLSIVDVNGKVLMPFKYKEFEKWNKWEVITKENGKLGYFNIHQKIDITPRYDYINDIWYEQYPLWKVKKNGKIGYINKNQLEYFKD